MIGLHFVADMTAHAAAETDPTTKQHIHHLLIKTIGVNGQDLAVLAREANMAQTRLRPPGNSIRTGEARATAITSIIQDLATSLSPGGLRAFQKFVNGPLRQATTVRAYAVGSAALHQ